MLHEFVTANREEIIARCRARISSRPAPVATDIELEHGVPLFLEQLAKTLRLALTTPDPAIGESAAKHGTELLHRGFSIAQVVHDYGGVCQTITELAVERAAPITTREFQTFNLCLDEAIAGAVTEYGRLREHAGTKHLGHLAHELRNLLNIAVLAFDTLQTGRVGMGGSTGAVLGRSLTGLRSLIDRELTEVRLGAGVQHRETLVVRDFIEEVEISATIDANARGRRFAVQTVERDVCVHADRHILAAVLANLLQNAFKFTHRGGQISLRVRATDARVLFEVEDACGGLPPGMSEALFAPFEQRSPDRSGLGLGLEICQRGVRVNDGKLRVHNRPGLGCLFTVDLPRVRLPT